MCKLTKDDLVAIDERDSKEKSMSDTEDTQSRPFGQTSASDERGPQQVNAPVLSFTLSAEIDALHHEREWQDNGQNAKTLVNDSDLSVVLIAMKRAARMHQHHAPARITIQAIRGVITVQIPDEEIALSDGSLLSLEANILHDIEALEESVFLLTIGRLPKER